MTLFSSCDEGDDIWKNSSTIEMTKDFALAGTQNDTLSLDFANGDVLSFEGEWNMETNWELIIKSLDSDNIDTLRGCSNSLKDIVWNGNIVSGEKYFPYSIMKKTFSNTSLFGGNSSDTKSAFKEGERCIAMLHFTDFYGTDTCKTIIKIESAQEEEEFTKNDYFVAADWDNIQELWTSDVTATYTIDGINAPEGKKCCVLEGTEKGGGWYVGIGAVTFKQANNWADGYYPITNEDTATTYINLFVYGFPDIDSTSKTALCKRSSLYLALAVSDSVEAGMQGERITVDEGWHGISIPVSRFQVKNGSFDYSKINTIRFTVFSNGEAGSVKTALDFLVITKKYPLFKVME